MQDSIWYKIETAKAGEIIENDYDGETWAKLSPEHSAHIVAENAVHENKSKIEFNGVIKSTNNYDGYECYVMALSGGLNGGYLEHKWNQYLYDINVILSRLQVTGKAWIINLDNDSCDDIFYLTIGFRINEGFKLNEQPQDAC